MALSRVLVPILLVFIAVTFAGANLLLPHKCGCPSILESSPQLKKYLLLRKSLSPLFHDFSSECPCSSPCIHCRSHPRYMNGPRTAPYGRTSYASEQPYDMPSLIAFMQALHASLPHYGAERKPYEKLSSYDAETPYKKPSPPPSYETTTETQYKKLFSIPSHQSASYDAQPSYGSTPEPSYKRSPQPAYEPASYNAQPSYKLSPPSYEATPEPPYKRSPQPVYAPTSYDVQPTYQHRSFEERSMPGNEPNSPPQY